MGTPFNIESYKKGLQTQWLGHDACYFESLGSTNSYMKGRTTDDVSHGQLCIADHQTKGRGQYNRHWSSPEAMNLMFTVAFKPTKVRGAHILGLAFARAIVAEIEDRTSLTATIKWPNDVYCKGKKIAGVLTETVFSGNRLDRLLIGVGFNVNQTEFNDALQQKASSLHLLTQTEFSRERVLCAVLQRLEYDYRRWHTADETLLPYINKKIQGYGQWLHLHVDGKQTAEKHKLLGVNEQGELTILSAAGDLKTYSYEQIRPLTG